MSDAIKVTLAYPMTINGRDYQPEDVVELPHKEDREGGTTAIQLVRDGRARYTEPDKTTTAKRSRATAGSTTSQEG